MKCQINHISGSFLTLGACNNIELEKDHVIQKLGHFMKKYSEKLP
jgi:hypothetical protein